LRIDAEVFLSQSKTKFRMSPSVPTEEEFLRSYREETLITPIVVKGEEFQKKYALLQESLDTSLPVFSTVSTKVYALACKADVDLFEIDELVKMDPGLFAVVMKCANSAYYGGMPVNTVQDAFMRMGLDVFRQTILIHGVKASVASLKVYAKWEDFWLHSVLVARLTERLHYCYAENTGMEYVGGLLHDVGKLFLQKIFPDDYQIVITKMKDEGLSSEQVELAMFGFCHQDVSALLCERWGLDRSVVAAVKYHHDPTNTNLSEYDAIVATCVDAANYLANYCGINLETLYGIDFGELENYPSWRVLRSFPQRHSLEIDVEKEIKAIRALLG